jgi:uncharacterized protein (DUF58 family)
MRVDTLINPYFLNLYIPTNFYFYLLLLLLLLLFFFFKFEGGHTLDLPVDSPRRIQFNRSVRKNCEWFNKSAG